MNVLETHVLELIGENVDSPDVFTDDDEGLAPIRDALNDAFEEITLLTGSYKESYQVLLVEDQAFYRLSLSRGSIAWITDTWLVGNKRRLTQTDVFTLSTINPRWLNNRGTPEYYIPIGHDILGVWPVPGGNDDILELTMVVCQQRQTTSNDIIKLRETFKWAAVDYAVGEFYASRGDAKESMMWHQKYREALGVFGIYPKAQDRNFQVGKRDNVATP